MFTAGSAQPKTSPRQRQAIVHSHTHLRESVLIYVWTSAADNTHYLQFFGKNKVCSCPLHSPPCPTSDDMRRIPCAILSRVTS